MSAARRSSGSGVVVALVIFVVLTFVCAGGAIWLYQQNAMLKQAVAENQRVFHAKVASIFQQHNWDLPEDMDALYGMKFGEKTFEAVAERLGEAVEYEHLRELLGWEGVNEVQAVLDTSPAQGQAERYSTVAGLMKFYEEQYVALTERVAQLEKDLRNKEQVIADKAAALTKLQRDLQAQIKQLDANYTAAIAQQQKQFNDMKAMYEQARAALAQLQESFGKARQDWEAQAAKLHKEIEGWKQLYMQATGGQEPGTKMKPAGKIMDVEPVHQFVILEGGRDAGRKPAEKYVVYSELPGAVRTRKAEVHVTEVYDTTSLATIFNQKEQVLAGDLFVSKQTWDSFYPPARVARAVPAPAQEQPAEQQAAPAPQPGQEAPAPAEETPAPAPEEGGEEGAGELPY